MPPVTKRTRIAWSAYAANNTPYTSAVLRDPSGSFGVRNVVTNKVVVEAGAAMTLNNGLFIYDFDAEPGEQYEYYILFTGGTHNPAGGDPYPSTAIVRDVIFSAFDWQDYRTLGGVRRLVVELSGRYDLLRDPENNDWTDDRGLLTFYVNEAQKWLDTRFTMPKHPSWLYKTLPANQSVVHMQHARYVISVAELQDDMTKKPISWATHYNGLAPEQERETALTLPKAADTVYYGAHWNTVSPITSIWVEPASVDRTIVLHVASYTRELVNANDRSYWTVQHPRLLAQTVMYLFEIPMRNSQGVQDLYNPIMDELTKVYHDYCAELAAGPAEHWVMRS